LCQRDGLAIVCCEGYDILVCSHPCLDEVTTHIRILAIALIVAVLSTGEEEESGKWKEE
jgi:hypothetical protein